MAAWCHGVGSVDDLVELGDERPIAAHAFTAPTVDHVSFQALCNTIIERMPNGVKTVLGKTDHKFYDTMHPSRVRLGCVRFGCYLSAPYKSTRMKKESRTWHLYTGLQPTRQADFVTGKGGKGERGKGGSGRIP
jgi:hypothetical protein